MSSDGQGSVSPPRDADDNRGVKNKFSGNLKHELRTPLNHIIGYCEMLMEQAQDDGLDIFLADRVDAPRGSHPFKPDNRLCRNVTGAGERLGIRFLRFRFAEGAYRGPTFARPHRRKFRLDSGQFRRSRKRPYYFQTPTSLCERTHGETKQGSRRGDCHRFFAGRRR
ncbi:MAG: hypothetical protein DMF23_08120 [Verrucomicrobia bacterium]|nr:MAG: hypothetical protein DMF23_08120 [Verrucomicrobiota bacterium]